MNLPGIYGAVEVLLSVGGEVGGVVVISEISVCRVKCVLSLHCSGGPVTLWLARV